MKKIMAHLKPSSKLNIEESEVHFYVNDQEVTSKHCHWVHDLLSSFYAKTWFIFQTQKMWSSKKIFRTKKKETDKKKVNFQALNMNF